MTAEPRTLGAKRGIFLGRRWRDRADRGVGGGIASENYPRRCRDRRVFGFGADAGPGRRSRFARSPQVECNGRMTWRACRENCHRPGYPVQSHGYFTRFPEIFPPFWWRTRLLNFPSASLTKLIWASAALRKNSVSASA